MRLVLLCGLAHFIAAFVTRAIAEGFDFDQLPSRSTISQIAGYVHDFLMAPHSAVIRAMPNRWLTQGTFPVIPVWLAVHSLVWGAALAALVTWYRRGRSRG